MKKTLIIIAIIATAIATANAQSIIEINKSVDLSKKLVAIITKTGEEFEPREGHTLTANIEFSRFGSAGSLTSITVYIDGKIDFANNKIIEDARLFKAILEDGTTIYLFRDNMFTYSMLWESERGWVLSLNTKEN